MAKLKDYPRTFWVANFIEIFERMAYYGFFSLSALYITGKVSEGCLGFTSEQRGFIQGVGTFILYLLPVFTGALVERYGHKKILTASFLILAPGYYILGIVDTFWGFFGVFLLVAFGAAMFKPAITGTIARTTTPKTSSFGWGIFYMVVNIGGFIGPLVAGILRNWDWKWIFGASAVWIVVNLLLVTIFYKEPPKSVEASKSRSLKDVLNGMVSVLGNGRLFLTVFVVIVLLMVMAKGWMSGTSAVITMTAWAIFNLLVDIPLRKISRGSKKNWWLRQPMKLGNWQFVIFLLILSGFWMIYNQIFFTAPEYIRDFVDTSTILVFLSKFFGALGLTSLAVKMTGLINSGYQINPEFIINLNPLSIIILQLFVTWAFLKRKPFVTMMAGIVVTMAGMLLFALGAIKVSSMGAPIAAAKPALIASGWIVILGIVIFTIGEMLTSPKSQEYIALIAPKDKVAIFMGYYFVAVALGNLFGGLLSGGLYGWLARDLCRPDLMWMAFAILAFVVLLLFIIYNEFVIKAKKDDLPTHEAHMVHAADGEDVPEVPELE